MRRTILIAVVGLILILIFNYAYTQETITLSTYYPAPYGEYRKLAIGSSTGGYTAPTAPNIDLVVEGGVGIGTTSPVGKLHVNSVEILGNSSDDDGDGFIDEYEDVIFTTNGNVGIGTTDPQATLHIGNTGAANNGIMFPDGSLQTVAAIGMPPIGSIIAWHKNLTGVPALPDGWVECNGQVLSDSDSPLNGQTIPNLNGGGRFLRGGSTSGTIQADEIKSHSHTMTAKPGYSSGTGILSNDGWRDPSRVESTDNFGGSETRPVNMSVVWIMRVK